MPKIEFDGWSAFPNPTVEELCRDQRLSLEERVFFALLRLIIGHSYNRKGNEGKASYTALQTLTRASRQHIIKACLRLEAQGKITINRSLGREGNTYIFHFSHEKTGTIKGSQPDRRR